MTLKEFELEKPAIIKMYCQGCGSRFQKYL